MLGWGLGEGLGVGLGFSWVRGVGFSWVRRQKRQHQGGKRGSKEVYCSFGSRASCPGGSEELYCDAQE